MFDAGQTGNPRGRPKGSYGGRIQALAVLDRLMAQKKRQSALMQALGRDFDKDPVRFFKSVIMPLLPREAKLAVEHDGIVIWRNLLGQEVKAEDVGGLSDGGAVGQLGEGADAAGGTGEAQ